MKKTQKYTEHDAQAYATQGNKIRYNTGWVKTVGPKTGDHNSVKF